MKKLYIAILFVSGSTFAFAQENKPSEEKQEIPKEIVEAHAKLYEKKTEKPARTTLASEEGLENSKPQNNKAASASGKAIPGDADIYAIKASITGRKPEIRKQSQKKNVKGLPNTATLQEIKATIPKTN